MHHCISLEGSQLDFEVAITPAGSLDSSAIVGRKIALYPADDIPRTTFHFLQMPTAKRYPARTLWRRYLQ